MRIRQALKIRNASSNSDIFLSHKITTLNRAAIRLRRGFRCRFAFTDYPFVETLGDVPNQKAPIRRVEVICRETLKYVYIKVNGIDEWVKCCYLYETPGRCGEVKTINISAVPFEDGTKIWRA